MSFKKDGRKFKFDTDEFEIAIISDWHLGAPSCCIDMIQRQIEYIKKTKNCYAIVCGDILETAIYGSKGLVHEQKFFSNEQVKIAKKFLDKIQNKILFVLGGNHCFRFVKATTLDIMEMFCDWATLDYQGPEYHFALQCKRGNILSCFAGHGRGSGQTPGAKLNSLHSLHWRLPAGDIIIGGHTHGSDCTEQPIYYLDKNFNLVEKIQHFVAGWSALSSDKGYAARAHFRPLSNGWHSIKIKLNRTFEAFDINIIKHR